jgi:hypothetical protein
VTLVTDENVRVGYLLPTDAEATIQDAAGAKIGSR